jgi:hypothetical protein
MIGKRPLPTHRQKEVFTMRTPFPRLAVAKRFPALIVALVLLFGLTAPSEAEDGDWSEFVFDSSSDSYKVRGERAFDLRNGRHSASAQRRSGGGDFITVSSFNPEWVTLITAGRLKILFSFGAANDPKVEEKAERISNCVPIPYGGSYVASFDDRAYTIKLVAGTYDSPAGYAKFLYKAGGTPGPEHEPRKTSRNRRRPEAKPEQSGSVRTTDPSRTDEPGSTFEEAVRIDVVTVTVIMPRPKNEDSPESHELSLSMNTSYEGGFSSKNRMSSGVKEGSEETFTFNNVLPATYKAQITYDGKTITDTVVIDDRNTRIEFAFE